MNSPNLGHFTDLSIDLETLGTKVGSVITQIGLCAFSAHSNRERAEELIHVDPQSCLDHGLEVSWATIRWWLMQDKEPRELMAQAQGVPLSVALMKVRSFIKATMIEDFCVWGNGSNFDVALLDFAFERCAVPTPWHYRNVRDLRTLRAISPHAPPVVPSMLHNAMHDATAQAGTIQRCLLYLASGSRPPGPASPPEPPHMRVG